MDYSVEVDKIRQFEHFGVSAVDTLQANYQRRFNKMVNAIIEADWDEADLCIFEMKQIIQLSETLEGKERAEEKTWKTGKSIDVDTKKRIEADRRVALLIKQHGL